MAGIFDGGSNFERREFLKRAGTVAWATPLIYTLMSKPAFAQVPLACGTHTGGFGDPCTNPNVTCPSGTTCLGGEEVGPVPANQCGCIPDGP